jgi:hypothetical protein
VTLIRIVGDIKVRSDDGSVKLDDCLGDLDIQSDDGRITVIYRENAVGVFDISLVTDDGAVDFKAPANFSADVDVISDGSVYTDILKYGEKDSELVEVLPNSDEVLK